MNQSKYVWKVLLLKMFISLYTPSSKVSGYTVKISHSLWHLIPHISYLISYFSLFTSHFRLLTPINHQSTFSLYQSCLWFPAWDHQIMIRAHTVNRTPSRVDLLLEIFDSNETDLELRFWDKNRLSQSTFFILYGSISSDVSTAPTFYCRTKRLCSTSPLHSTFCCNQLSGHITRKLRTIL